MLYVFFTAIKQRAFLAGLVSLKGKEEGKNRQDLRSKRYIAYIDLNRNASTAFGLFSLSPVPKQAGK